MRHISINFRDDGEAEALSAPGMVQSKETEAL